MLVAGFGRAEPEGQTVTDPAGVVPFSVVKFRATAFTPSVGTPAIPASCRFCDDPPVRVDIEPRCPFVRVSTILVVISGIYVSAEELVTDVYTNPTKSA